MELELEEDSSLPRAGTAREPQKLLPENGQDPNMGLLALARKHVAQGKLEQARCGEANMGLIWLKLQKLGPRAGSDNQSIAIEISLQSSLWHGLEQDQCLCPLLCLCIGLK